MNLGEKQELFASLVPRLIDKALDLGYGVRIFEVQRSKEQALWNSTHCAICRRHRDESHPGHTFRKIGIATSLHTIRLAIDLGLFKDGIYLTAAKPYRPLGEFWESLDELCCWGGRFRDPGHFSLTHGGRK